MSLTKLNMLLWIFYFDFFIQVFFSALIVVYNVDDHYMISKINDPEARVKGFYSLMYMMIFFPVGLNLVNLFFNFSAKNEYSKYLEKPIMPSISYGDSYIKVPLYLFSFVSFLTILYTFYTLRSFPILKMFSGADSLLLATMRADAKSGFEGVAVIRNIFGLVLTPVLCYISYAYYKYSKRRSDFLWFIVMAILSVLILTYNLEKSPVVFFLIGFVFLKVYIDGSVSKKTLMVIGAVCLAVIILFYTFLSVSFSVNDMGNFRQGILGRILLGQSTGVYLTFDTYPNVQDFIGVKSLSQNFLDFFGLQQEDRSSRILMERYNPRAVTVGYAGVINTFFIAEAYANYSLLGLIISPLYVGMIIQCLYIFFVRGKKSPIMLGLFAYFSYSGSISGGINEYIYNPKIVLLVLIFGFVYSLAFQLKKIN